MGLRYIAKRVACPLTVGILCAALTACGHSPTSATPPLALACPSVSPYTSLDGAPQVVNYALPTLAGGHQPVGIACTPASGSSFPVGQDPVNCTATDAKKQTAMCTFTVVVQPPPIIAVTSFLAFGDSITWGEDGTNGPSTTQAWHPEVQLTGQTYPDDLEKELQARYLQQMPTVTECGYRGETLTVQQDDGSWVPNQAAVDRFLTNIGTGQYRAVLIMEGSNDLSVSRDSNVMGPAVGVLQTMVDSAKAAGMHPFLATIPPMVPPGDPSRTAGSALVPAYDNMIKTLAGNEGVPLVDVYGAFGTNAPTLIGFDGLHPNAAGYQLIADTFFAAIKTVLESQMTMKLLTGRHVAATGGECPGLPS